MASLIQNFLDAPDYFEYSPWFPNPLIVVRDMVRTGSSEVYARLPWNGMGVWLKESWGWMYTSLFLDWNVLLIPLLIAISLTLARVLTNFLLLKVEYWSRPQTPTMEWESGNESNHRNVQSFFGKCNFLFFKTHAQTPLSQNTTHNDTTRSQRIPVYFKFTEENCEKFTESVWKCSIYTITWVWAVYLALFGEEQYFFNLKSHWDSECGMSLHGVR